MNVLGGTGTEVFWHTRGTAEDRKLANIIAPKLASKCGVRNRGVKTAEFTVLTCRATAILCEGGFMDNANDYKLIISDRGQQAYADAIVEGLVEYLGLTKKQIASSNSSFTSYKVKIVNCDSLNVRKNADINSPVVTTVKKNEVYTIVGQNGIWLKLKSGAGWISSKYTQKI